MTARVQLDDVELDAKLLEDPGGPLPTSWEGLEVRGPQALPEESALPSRGWRSIHDRICEVTWPHRRLSRSVVLAAPAEVPEAWWLLHLALADDHWDASRGFDPARVRPGKSARRAHLRLGWPSAPVVARLGELHRLRVVLANTFPVSWAPDEEDSVHLLGWVTDLETGESLPYEPMQAWGGFGPSVTLRPGASTELSVRLATRQPEALRPGDYGLLATLISLDLTSEPGRLRLVE